MGASTVEVKAAYLEGATKDFVAELEELAALFDHKQHDYGSTNISDFGLTGVLVRANDKMARLKNLHKSGKSPHNESVEDSWRDMAVYSIIALMLLHGTWPNQEESC